MLNITRRNFVSGTVALPVAAARARPADEDRSSVAADLERYVEFGVKQSGGKGDNACGAWLERELERAGYAIERLEFAAPYFEPEMCEIECGGQRAEVWPQPVVIPTTEEGLKGPLVGVDAAGNAALPLAGAIALVSLPSCRWSSLLAKPVRQPIEAAFAAGAHAVVAITNGPSGQLIALNADGRAPMFAGPVALLAPADAGPFLASASRGGGATLRLVGRGGHRPAYNFVGRLDRGRGRWVAVSTPRSGWFRCAAERGGGVAAWLKIARWAAEFATEHDLAFICNSGHEYEYLGAEETLRRSAPKPESTDFWLHLGANLAARDWHEAVGAPKPLPGADSQRYLVVSEPLLPEARNLFAGLAGLEAPYGSAELSAGELTGIIEAGYPSVAGVFGIHRYHHTRQDDWTCLSAQHVAETAKAFQGLVEAALSIRPPR